MPKAAVCPPATARRWGEHPTSPRPKTRWGAGGTEGLKSQPCPPVRALYPSDELGCGEQVKQFDGPQAVTRSRRHHTSYERQ